MSGNPYGRPGHLRDCGRTDAHPEHRHTHGTDNPDGYEVCPGVEPEPSPMTTPAHTKAAAEEARRQVADLALVMRDATRHHTSKGYPVSHNVARRMAEAGLRYLRDAGLLVGPDATSADLAEVKAEVEWLRRGSDAIASRLDRLRAIVSDPLWWTTGDVHEVEALLAEDEAL